MTALQKYERLEATGLWRATPQDQRREAIVSIGDATLVISDTRDRVLAHWSLPAVERANPGDTPAIYHPDGDQGETLELAAEEAEMIAAIEKLRSAIDRRRPRPGRLRYLSVGLSVLAGLALLIFWFPGALLDHTLAIVPEAKRQDIGRDLLRHTERLTGQPCRERLADPALARLAARLGVRELRVVRDGVKTAITLPGGVMLLNRAIVEDFESPEATAGFVIAEKIRAETRDPLRDLLNTAGSIASLRLLTTGTLPPELLRAYAEWVVVSENPALADDLLLTAFSLFSVRPSPYAYALDPSGETTLALVEGDALIETPRPVLTDGDWVALQGICEN